MLQRDSELDGFLNMPAFVRFEVFTAIMIHVLLGCDTV